MTDDNILNRLYKHLHATGMLPEISLKGGWIMQTVYDSPRATRDIDGSLESSMSEIAIPVLESSLLQFFKLEGIKQYKMGMTYSKTTFRAKFKYDSRTYGLDVSIKENVPREPHSVLSLETDIYPLENSLYDKLSVVFAGNLCRRIKDLYDIYYVVTHCEIKYDRLKLYVDSNEKFDSCLITMDILDRIRDNTDILHAYKQFEVVKDIPNPDLEELLAALKKLIINIQ